MSSISRSNDKIRAYLDQGGGVYAWVDIRPFITKFGFGQDNTTEDDPRFGVGKIEKNRKLDLFKGELSIGLEAPNWAFVAQWNKEVNKSTDDDVTWFSWAPDQGQVIGDENPLHVFGAVLSKKLMPGEDRKKKITAEETARINTVIYVRNADFVNDPRVHDWANDNSVKYAEGE